jgi:hypothetical protein
MTVPPRPRLQSAKKSRAIWEFVNAEKIFGANRGEEVDDVRAKLDSPARFGVTLRSGVSLSETILQNRAR